MIIDIMVDKLTKAADSVNKHLAEITSTVTTGSVVYFNYANKTLDSLFAIGTAVISAVLSYLAVKLCKHIINKINDKKD